MLRKSFTLIGLVAAAACGETDQLVDPALKLDAGVNNAADAASHEYEITITNLTSGQPLSPGAIATHTSRASFFSAGEAASEGLRLIAEGGDPSTAAAELTATEGVDEVLATMAPVHRVGGPGPSSLTTTISARANATQLSLALMLICTNDGFVGLDGVTLPQGSKARTYYAAAYDAGTEVNDEMSETIVDGCFAIGPTSGAADGNDRTAEGGVVRAHPGIQGGGALDPMQHGWTDPVARVTVRRIK
jgi:hypothetical protein